LLDIAAFTVLFSREILIVYARGAAREPLGVEFLWSSKSLNW